MRAPGRELSTVRTMINWTSGTVVAVLAVVFLAAGLVLASVQSPVRAGGLPLVRPGQMPPVVASGGPTGVSPFVFRPARFHRRFFDVGLPLAGVGPGFVPFDESITYVGTIPRPVVVHAPDDGSLNPENLVNRGGCRSETRMVPSEAGGEHPIKITWCRKG
jgi:hypothetical protein